MNRLITKLLRVALPTLGCLTLCEIALEISETPMEKAAFRKLYAPAPLERLVMGSSQAQCSIDPRRVPRKGPAFQNFAMFGAGPAYTLAWYAGFRRHHPPPTHVLLDAPWFQFRPDTLWRTYDHDAGFLDLTDLWAAATRPDRNWQTLVGNRFALLRNRDSLLLGTLGPDAAAEWDAQRGYLAFRHAAHELSFAPAAFSAPDDPAYVAAFESLLSRLRHDQVSVVLLTLPTVARLSPPHQVQDAVITRIATAHHMPWLNYNGALGNGIPQDATHFWNWSHFNAAGAQAFSDRLAGDLARLGWPETPHAVQ